MASSDEKLVRCKSTKAEESTSEMSRRTDSTSTASTALPAYLSSESLPPYEQRPASSSAQPARSQGLPRSQSTGHEGSCGMPASMVMGVLGGAATPSLTGSKTSSHQHSLGKEGNAGGRLSPDARNSTSGRWNVQGTTLSDFGNPFRRSK